jgi:hypothetical protein
MHTPTHLVSVGVDDGALPGRRAAGRPHPRVSLHHAHPADVVELQRSLRSLQAPAAPAVEAVSTGCVGSVCGQAPCGHQPPRTRAECAARPPRSLHLQLPGVLGRRGCLHSTGTNAPALLTAS